MSPGQLVFFSRTAVQFDLRAPCPPAGHAFLSIEISHGEEMPLPFPTTTGTECDLGGEVPVHVPDLSREREVAMLGFSILAFLVSWTAGRRWLALNG